MKYSNHIGILAALGLIISCFLPWVYIETIHANITGLNAENTNFGRPGLINIILASVSVFLFLIQKIWSKRLNLLICAFIVAWSVRNFLLVTQCNMGECPIKKPAIYASILFSFLLLLMSMLPKLEIVKKEVN